MVYLAILLLILILEKIKFKGKELLVVIILVIVSSIRYNIGFDYKVYFKIIKTNDLYQIQRFEFFNKLVLFFTRICSNIQVFFLIYSLLIIGIVYLVIKKYSYNKMDSIFIWYTEPLFFLTSLSSVRQSLAVSICFFSLKYIFEKKQIKFLMTIGVAILCHKSAVIFLPMYYVYQLDFIKYSRKNMLLVVGIFLIVRYFFIFTIGNMLGYGNYFRIEYSYGQKIALIMLLYSFLCFLFIKDSQKKEERFLIFLSFVGGVLYFGLKNIYGASRIGRYYLMTLPLCIPIFEKNRRYLKKYRIIFFTLIFIIALIISEKGVYLPYKTIFQLDFKELKI